MTSKTSQVLCWSWGWSPGRRAGGFDATLAQPDGRSSGRSASMLPLLTLPTMLDAFDPALCMREHAGMSAAQKATKSRSARYGVFAVSESKVSACCRATVAVMVLSAAESAHLRY